MAVELQVNGFFELTFIDPVTKKEVSEELEKVILANLQNGTYLFGMDSKNIVSLENLSTNMYEVVIEPTDAVNYEFNKL